MTDFSSALQITVTGMKAQAQRLTHVSENIANADTPGYKRKIVRFEEYAGADQIPGGVQAGDVFLDRSNLPQIFDPSHPMANADGYYQGSNVNLMIEIADAREAQRGYEANLRMFAQARSMSSDLLDLVRKR